MAECEFLTVKWTTGVYFTAQRLRTTVLDDYARLIELYPNPPQWVKQYYDT